MDPYNCTDPRAAERASAPKTRAMIPVHLGSNMANMDSIMALAEKYDLVAVEDPAHSHGVKWNGKGASTTGHFGFFSGQSSKTLSSGDGSIHY